MKTFKDLVWEQDKQYPHEKLGKDPKYNSSYTVNGFTLSVVYGGSSYGAGPEADTFEVALFDDETDKMISLERYDDVSGWIGSHEITLLIQTMNQQPERIGNHLKCLIN